MILGTFVIGNLFLSPDKAVSSRMLGHDFLAFYSAGTFARTGQFNRLYDLEATRDAERQAAASAGLEIGPSFGPYWNPPFYAWVFAPLSALPYRAALSVWTCISLLCLSAAVTLLIRILPADLVVRPPAGAYISDPGPVQFQRDWRSAALVPLLMCVSMPFIQAISHGQNTFTSLMLLTLVVSAWRKRWPILAGAACGLMFYKPQLAAVIAAMLMLSLGLRVLIGLGSIGCALAAVTVFTMPGTIETYITQLPDNLRYMQIDHAYLWERHVTLKAFWRLLFQGRDAGETSLLVTALTITSCGTLAISLFAAWRALPDAETDDCFTGETRALAMDRLIGAAICSMPLLMPFYFDYDLLLLSVPATLFAAEIASMPPGSKLDSLQRTQLMLWAGLFLWFMVNPGIAAMSGVNVTVFLLTSLSTVTILRTLHGGTRTESITPETKQYITIERLAA